MKILYTKELKKSKYSIKNILQNTIIQQIILIISILNEIFGAGIAAIPYSVDRIGPIVGVLLMIISAIFTEFNLRIIIELTEYYNAGSFKELYEKMLGKIVSNLINFLHIFIAFIVYISLSMLSTSNICNIVLYFFPNSKIVHPKYITPFIAGLVIPMVCLLKDSHLQIISNTSLIFIIATFGLILYAIPFISSQRLIYSSSLRTDLSYIPTSISIISFALACQTNIISIYKEYPEMNSSKFMKCTRIALLISAITYIIISLACLITFGVDIDLNFYDEYCIQTNIGISIRILNTLSLTITSITQMMSVKEIIWELKLFANHFQTTKRSLPIIFGLSCIIISISFIIQYIELGINIITIIIVPPLFFGIYPTLLLIKFWRKLNYFTKITSITSVIFSITLLISCILTLNFSNTGEINVIKYWCMESLGFY